MATEVDPDIGAPAKRIHWPENVDKVRQYDDDEVLETILIHCIL